MSAGPSLILQVFDAAGGVRVELPVFTVAQGQEEAEKRLRQGETWQVLSPCRNIRLERMDGRHFPGR